MSQLLEFSVLVIVISASGVMAPGPLFAANIAHGLRGGVKSGIKMAIGHTIVELPLVILLGIGVCVHCAWSGVAKSAVGRNGVWGSTALANGKQGHDGQRAIRRRAAGGG